MKKLIKKLLEKAGYDIVSLTESRNPQRLLPLKIKYFLDLYFSRVDPKSFFFVEIGAHDGKHHDPLYPFVTKYNLRGVALEPQMDVFKELQETYKNYGNVTCINAAVGERTGQQAFFTIEGDSSVGTFKKEILIPYKKPIRENTVEVITLDDLVKRFSVKKIDFLHTDCEGYDFEILKMFDFKRFSPQIVTFESVLLSDTDRSACENLLRSLGYTFFRYERDTCAYKL